MTSKVSFNFKNGSIELTLNLCSPTLKTTFSHFPCFWALHHQFSLFKLKKLSFNNWSITLTQTLKKSWNGHFTLWMLQSTIDRSLTQSLFIDDSFHRWCCFLALHQTHHSCHWVKGIFVYSLSSKALTLPLLIIIALRALKPFKFTKRLPIESKGLQSTSSNRVGDWRRRVSKEKFLLSNFTRFNESTFNLHHFIINECFEWLILPFAW